MRRWLFAAMPVQASVATAGHTPSGPSGHLPQQAGEGKGCFRRSCSAPQGQTGDVVELGLAAREKAHRVFHACDQKARAVAVSEEILEPLLAELAALGV